MVNPVLSRSRLDFVEVQLMLNQVAIQCSDEDKYLVVNEKSSITEYLIALDAVV